MANLPTRNNNPGDLKDPSTGAFQQYSDPKQGYAALLNDLHAKQTGTTSTGLGPNSSLADFAKVYAPPSDNNNTAKYAADLANKIGVAPNTPLSQLDLGKWADAVAGNEGYQGYNPKPFSNPQGGTTDPGAINFSGVTQPASDPSNPGFLQGLGEDLTGTNPQSIGTQLANTAKGVGNFLFPAVGDVYNDLTGNNQKSALQQIGDVGLTALPFIPGLGEAGEAARGAEAVGEGAETAAPAASGLLGKFLGSSVAKNTALGYGAGVASNLSQGQGVGQALTPQLSNLGGAVLGGGSAALLNKLAGGGTDQGVIDKLQGIWGDAFGATKTGIKGASRLNADTDVLPEKFLANAGIVPETEEVNGRTVFKTGEDSQTYKTIQDRVDNLTALRDKLIDASSNEDLGGGMTREANDSSLADLRQKALDEAQTQFFGTERQKAVQHINTEFDTLAEQMGGEDVPLAGLNIVKKYFQDNSNYDTMRPSTITATNKMVASLARQQVESDAEKSGVPGIGEVNKMIHQHLSFLNTNKKGLLDKINGQVVKGGRIGNHAKEVAGSVIGAMASQGLGGGPVGDIAAGIAGGFVGNQASRLMQALSVGGGTLSGRIGKIASEEPQLLDQLVQLLRERGVETEGKVAPQLVARKAASGVAHNLVTKGAARVGAAL